MSLNTTHRLPAILQLVGHTLYDAYQTYPFYRIRKHANGSMGGHAYRTMYEYATKATHANMIEVGAAHGAATISLARAIDDVNADATLYTFEGGQARFTLSENIDILQRNLEAFGVADAVTIIPELLTTDSEVPERIRSNQPYSLLCLDADGNLIRDFQLFYDLLLPNAVIIIDDYDLAPAATASKKYRTFCEANHFEEQGLIRFHEVVGNTLFATKTPHGIVGNSSRDSPHAEVY